MRLFHNLDPRGCPYCGHKNFLVKQVTSTLFVTNCDGEICASKDELTIAVGKCLKCGNEFDCYPALDSFIPLTQISKFLLEYATNRLDLTNSMDETYIKNPIEVDK